MRRDEILDRIEAGNEGRFGLVGFIPFLPIVLLIVWALTRAI